MRMILTRRKPLDAASSFEPPLQRVPLFIKTSICRDQVTGRKERFARLEGASCFELASTLDQMVMTLFLFGVSSDASRT